MDLSKLPGALTQALLPFQKEGVRFAIEKNGRVLIADEMGLGKTIQAISVAYFYRDEWPLLVIVPSCVKYCWIEEFEKWLPDILPQDINLIQSGNDASGIADSPISIVTYGLLRNPSAKLVQETIRRRKFQVVICDESHYLKNTQTLSSKIIVPIIKIAKRRILLSGTPALARPVELYPQLDAVCPGQWDSFWKFTERYCEPRYLHYRGKKQRKADGASNLEELQQRMSGMLMIRREKSQVLTELPPKQRQRVLFDLKDSSLKKDITNKLDSLRKNIHKGNRTFQQLAASMDSVADGEQTNQGNGAASASQEDDGLAVFRDVSTLYRTSGEAKIGPVREYIEMLCENQDLKFLVFAYHHNMMDGVEQTLHNKKVRFVRIDGSTKAIDRQANVSQFQSDPSTRVAILSILAAGVGLTLTSAKLVVFAELYWTPGVMAQCEDRAHRIGQVDPLSVHYLVARNTMDEWVWASVCKKTVVTSAALTGKCRKLEHLEGEQYQIDVLSKADVWVPQEGDEADAQDVSKLIKSQRQPDQPSILDFLSSPRQHNNLSNGGVNKIGTAKSAIGSHMTKFSAIRFASPATKIKAANKNLNNSLIVIDSDEEEEFEPASKKRKKEIGSSVQVKKTIEEESQNKRENCDGLSKLQNTIENDGEAYDISSDSDDLFNDKNSDSDSDSLPDVYLGEIWEKTKLQDRNARAKKSGFNESCQPIDNEIHVNKWLCEKIETKGQVGTRGEKWKLSVEPSSSVCVREEFLNEIESNCPSNMERERKCKIELSPQTVEVSTIESNDVLSPNDLQSSHLSPAKSAVETEHCEDPVQDRNQPNSEQQKEEKKTCDNRPSSSTTGEVGTTQSDNGNALSDNSLSSTPTNSTFTPNKRKMGDEESAQWPCSMCTFLNHRELRQCEICNTPQKMRRRDKNKASKKAELVVSSFDASQQSSQSQSEVSPHSQRSVLSSSNGNGCSITMTDNSATLSPCDVEDVIDQNAIRIRQNVCGAVSEKTRDFNRDVEKSDVAVVHCEAECVVNENEENYEIGNSNCDSAKDSQPEEDIENYDIENVESDDEMETESKGVLKIAMERHEINNSCNNGDESCAMNKSCDKDVELKIRYDSINDELSSLCDFERNPMGCDNKIDHKNNKDMPDTRMKNDISHCRSNVGGQDKAGVDGEIFPCDELSADDFDQIEDFLSMNGHISVVGKDKLPAVSVISSHEPSSSASCEHAIDSISTSMTSTCDTARCVTSTLSFKTSSSLLQYPPSSSSSSSTSATTTTTTVNSSATNPPSGPPFYKSFLYSCSLHTGRIYLYDERGQSLKVNFQPVDIETDNTEKLPDFLQQPHHYRLLQRFVREWMSLTATKRRVIAKQGILFERPLQAYESVKSVHGNTQRHLVKSDLIAASEKAEMIQGHVRLIQRPNQDGVMVTTDGGRDVGGTAQVVTSDGVPLCLQCQKPYSNPLLPQQVIIRPQNAWQLRLCSRACMDKYWTLKHAGYLREQILEIERGICRLCHFDAHGFYNRMRCTKDVRQRAEMVNKSPYSKLGHKARERLVTQVVPGHFWHVDHIVPVWRGGGMCDLDNLRTLCTPCHAKVTKEQAGQRANIRKLSTAVSSGDITAFFKKS